MIEMTQEEKWETFRAEMQARQKKTKKVTAWYAERKDYRRAMESEVKLNEIEYIISKIPEPTPSMNKHS